MTDDDLVDAREAARLVGKTRRTISRWAESGRLPIAVEHRGDEKTALRLFRRGDVLAAVEPNEAA